MYFPEVAHPTADPYVFGPNEIGIASEIRLLTHMCSALMNRNRIRRMTRQQFYCVGTDEILGFFLLLKNHIFIARSEDTIFIFHV